MFLRSKIGYDIICFFSFVLPKLALLFSLNFFEFSLNFFVFSQNFLKGFMLHPPTFALEGGVGWGAAPALFCLERPPGDTSSNCCVVEGSLLVAS